MRNLNLASLVLAVVLALMGSLAYMHGTFVTYREFTAALTALRIIPPNAHLISPGLTDAAWDKALKLAHATEAEAALTPPTVWYVAEPRYVMTEFGPSRLCGFTMPTITVPELDASRLRADVLVYMRPEELALTLDIVTHEFLHYIWMYRVIMDPSFRDENPNSENWVRSVLAIECPVN